MRVGVTLFFQNYQDWERYDANAFGRPSDISDAEIYEQELHLGDLIEPLGSETLVHGHLAGGEEQSLTVKLVGPPPPGDRLSVAPQLEHLHVFDEPSGRRIDPICEETATSPLAAANTAD